MKPTFFAVRFAIAASIASLVSTPAMAAPGTKEKGKAAPAGTSDAPAKAADRDGSETKPDKIKLSAAEQAAVDNYKSEMLAIQKWLQNYMQAENQQEGHTWRIPLLLSEKLATVKTKGLPAKLSGAFTAFRKNIDAQAALIREMPKDETAGTAWMKKHLEDEKFRTAYNDLAVQQSEAEHTLTYAGVDCGAGIESDLFQTSELAQIKERWVVILAASKDFAEVRAEAQKVAKATGIPFSLRGMIFDKKGLRYPDNLDDEVYAGLYGLRRGNETSEGEKLMENHVSVEKSGEYDGFAPGLYIAVGYISDTPEDAEKKAADFRKFAPGTYVKKTSIFMGCDR